MRILFLFLAVIFTCGCRKNEKVEKNKRTLRISFVAELRTLDPRLGAEPPSVHVIRMLFDGLMRRDREGKAAPTGAKSYNVSEDQRIYTFHLRECYWSDGVPVTAYDYEYAWKASLNPASLSHEAQNFYFIKNAELAARGKGSVENIGVKALDDKTLYVELEYPAPYFVDILACTIFSPIPKHIVEKDPNWARKTDASFISNGPFKLKKWNLGNHLVVEKNPLYWDAEQVHLPEIKISFIQDGMTPLYLYEKKELDWIGRPLNKFPPEVLEALRKDPNYTAIDSLVVHWFFVNTERFPLNHKKLRQALAYAIDRQVISDHIYGQIAHPAVGILSPSFQLEQNPCFKDRDIFTAKLLFEEVLEELGLTRENFPSITLKYASGVETLHRIAQAVQQMWKDSFGIKVELEQTEWPVYFTSVQQGNYEIGMMGRAAFFCDPIFMLQTFKFKRDLVNMSNWENESFQKLLEKSNLEIDLEKRKQIFIDAEKLLVEEMPIIPLCFTKIEYVKNPSLTGVNLSPSEEIDFKFAEFR